MERGPAGLAVSVAQLPGDRVCEIQPLALSRNALAVRKNRMAIR